MLTQITYHLIVSKNDSLLILESKKYAINRHVVILSNNCNKRLEINTVTK
jgi:hypothetical protein